MIRPTKYMKLDTCVLRVSAVLLAGIREFLAIPITEIEASVEAQLGEDGLANVHQALSLLFLLGLIEYDEGSDAIVTTGMKLGSP